nr:MAG TPA: hypothetical protein [Caudoviricetes sp.]DAP48333.1 MAG TPA: hypothetical protein [Caudoviricetes sp.]
MLSSRVWSSTLNTSFPICLTTCIVKLYLATPCQAKLKKAQSYRTMGLCLFSDKGDRTRR